MTIKKVLGRAIFMVLLCSLIAAASATNITDSLKKKAEQLSTRDFNAAMAICDEGVLKTTTATDKAVFYRIKGKACYFGGNFEKASQLFKQAIEIFEFAENNHELGLTLIEQAKLYRKTKVPDAAEKAYGRALALFSAMNDTLNMATVLNESGVLHEYRNDYDAAIRNYRQSLSLSEAIKDTTGMAYAYNFIAGAFLQQGRAFLAEEYAQKSLLLFEAKKDSFAVALTCSDLAAICLAGGRTADARNYISRSNVFAAPIQYLDLLANNHKQLADVLEREGKADSALAHFRKYAALKDSLFNTHMQEKILELNTQYETAAKDKEIARKKSQLAIRNILLLAGAGGLLLLLLLFFLASRAARLRHRNELQDTLIRQQDLAAKAIVEAEENERQRMSSTLHDGLGQLLSAAKMNLQSLQSYVADDVGGKPLYEKVITLLDHSIKEMRAVSHQMMPGAFLRHGLGASLKSLIEQMDTNALEVNLITEGLKEDYDPGIQIVLYRIFQECINNVIKHSKATRLFISLSQTKDYIDATIEDNGVGFDMAEMDKFKGIGLENLKTRVNFLKGILDISSRKGSGTLIAFHIPVNQ